MLTNWLRNITVEHQFLSFLRINQLPELEFKYKFRQEEYIYWITGTYNYIKPNIKIITKTIGFQYFSCYRERYQTFEIYIAPFQLELWLVLLTTLVLVIGLTWMYTYFTNNPFCAWIFILATMFEETGHVPKNMAENTYFRLTFGCWCIMSVILTNCYNGLMISDLKGHLCP